MHILAGLCSQGGAVGKHKIITGTRFHVCILQACLACFNANLVKKTGATINDGADDEIIRIEDCNQEYDEDMVFAFSVYVSWQQPTQEMVNNYRQWEQHVMRVGNNPYGFCDNINFEWVIPYRNVPWQQNTTDALVEQMNAMDIDDDGPEGEPHFKPSGPKMKRFKTAKSTDEQKAARARARLARLARRAKLLEKKPFEKPKSPTMKAGDMDKQGDNAIPD